MPQTIEGVEVAFYFPIYNKWEINIQDRSLNAVDETISKPFDLHSMNKRFFIHHINNFPQI